MKIIGVYDSDGNVTPFKKPIPVTQLSNALRDSDGFRIAVLDSYGDWVCPQSKAMGIKIKYAWAE